MLTCYLLPDHAHCCNSPSFTYVSSPAPVALHGAEAWRSYTRVRYMQPPTLMRLVR